LKDFLLSTLGTIIGFAILYLLLGPLTLAMQGGFIGMIAAYYNVYVFSPWLDRILK
jgi:ABC-type methionine transport system permease subunit